jgi:intracellular multiplication protein IcmV
MKKKSRSRIVRVFTRIINIRVWFDWDRMRSFSLFLVTGFKRLFVPQKPTRTESFAQAQKQYHLNDADLLVKQNALFRLSMVMVTAAFLIFIYAIYHIFYGTFRASIVSLVVMMIALVLAFRYHFWYFQIKNRKLGCTFKQWYRQGLLGEKE